eukprot:g19199.t1
MLRLVYLSILYWKYEGNVWALLTGKEQSEVPSDSTVSGDHVEDETGGIAPASNVPPVGSSSGSRWDEDDAQRNPALANSLKRDIIREKMTPLMMLTSVVADLDLFADWLFFEEGLEGQPQLLADFALAFTIVGTIMYALVTLEFHPISKVWTWLRKGVPLGEGQHVSLGRQLLLNIVVEDVPQLIITGIADPTSGAGVLNLATAGFSLLAKGAEAVSTLHDPPMAAQARKIEADPGAIRYVNRQKRKAEELVARTTGLLTTYREEGRRGRNGNGLAAIAFRIMQVDGGFLDGELAYVRKKLDVPVLKLGASGLGGTIPPELGGLAALQELYLSGNQLTGITAEARSIFPDTCVVRL